jgi:hypothetical protein
MKRSRVVFRSLAGLIALAGLGVGVFFVRFPGPKGWVILAIGWGVIFAVFAIRGRTGIKAYDKDL